MSAVFRKRTGMAELVFPSGEDKKKRRKDTKSKSTFKPIVHSSDTPPEDDTMDVPPPPPSERKPSRRRASSIPPPGRSQRESSTSPTRQVVTSKKQESSRTSSGDPGPSSLKSMAPPSNFVRKTRKSIRGLSVGLGDESSLDSVVPIPENETPMIRKNKELREAQSRRSSFGNRGQRASSSLGRGEISMPHSTVDHKLFYTHLGTSMPEPIRARHLIAWCAKRAADDETGKKSKTKGKDRTSDGDRMVREIMEEVVMSLGRGNIDTNVFAQVKGGNEGTLRPHPRNVTNRKLYDEAEAVIKRSKEENNSWAKLINHTNTRLHATINRMKDKKAKDEIPEVSGSGWMEDALKLANGILAEGEGDLTKMGEFEDVEFKVDSLLNSTHVAVQYSRQSQLFLDGIFSSLTADLRAREQGPTEQIESDGPDAVALVAQSTKQSTRSKAKSKEKTDPMLMLRALAKADSQTADEEAIAAAAKVAPVASISVAPVSQGVSATPRRIGQATPRRIGQDRNGPTPKSARGVRAAEED